MKVNTKIFLCHGYPGGYLAFKFFKFENFKFSKPKKFQRISQLPRNCKFNLFKCTQTLALYFQIFFSSSLILSSIKNSVWLRWDLHNRSQEESKARKSFASADSMLNNKKRYHQIKAWEDAFTSIHCFWKGNAMSFVCFISAFTPFILLIVER